MTAPTCPVVDGVDLFDPEVLRDPYPVLARLREAGPVFLVPELDHHLVTRYADVEQVLLDRDTFSASIASSPIRPLGEHAARVLEAGGFRRVPTLNNADPPRHAPMRKAVLACLSPRRIAALEPAVQAYADDAVTELAAHDRIDLVATLSFPFPAHVAFALLGFPPDDAEQLKTWTRTRVLLTYGDLGADDQVRAAEATVAFWRYVERFVAQRLEEPADDLVTDLLAVHRRTPDVVTVDDVVNIVYSLALAGHETTTNLITNTVRALLGHRDQWDALRADPTLIPNAVDEAMRFDGPVLIHRRRAKVDTEIGGVAIPAEAKLMLVFGSAGRDERQFPAADTFDVRRPDAELHLGFGKGAHLCLGAPLARMEGRIALEALTSRLPDLALVPDSEVTFLPNAHFRSVSRLEVAPHGL